MARSPVLLVYRNGRMYEGDEGLMYDGPAPKPIIIERDMTLERLKKKLHSKLRLQANQCLSSIVFRFPQMCNTIRWMRYPLDDDDDVRCMIDCFDTHPDMRCMEIYVEIDTIDFSNLPETEIQSGPSFIYESIQPINTQESMAHASSSLVPHQEINIAEHCSLNLASIEIPENDNPFIRDALPDTSDDEGGLPEGNDSDTDVDEENLVPEVNLGDDGPPVMVPPESMFVPPNIPSVFVPPHSQFSHINWDVLNNPDNMIELDSHGMWRPEDELYVGLRFPNKEAVKLALQHYSIVRHQSYKVEDSDSQRLTAKCPRSGDGCNWRVRAIESKRSHMWQITKYNGPHSCVNQSASLDHQKLDSRMVCSCILGMVKTQPDVPICLIIERIRSQFGYEVSYRKAWKAKQLAIVKVFGGWDESYALLPRWIEAMTRDMEGTVVQLQDADYEVRHRNDPSKRVFRRLFWTFRPCVVGFRFCKPIVQIDATHLYGKYRHKLLIATTQDGDRKPLPIAFAIVEGETKDAWSWFLSNIRLHVTQQQGLCLISDRHRGIIQAVANPHIGWQPPNAYHVFCIRHIGSNFNSRFQDKELKKHLINTGI